MSEPASKFRAKNLRRRELAELSPDEKARLFSALHEVGLQMRKARPILGSSNMKARVQSVPMAFSETPDFSARLDQSDVAMPAFGAIVA